jgi:DNA polymerase bacteriophage-type
VKICFLDWETASEADLNEVGQDNYFRHPSTRIIMGAYAINNKPVKLWVPAKGEPMPSDLKAVFEDPEFIIVAHKADFERTALHRCLGIWIPFERWRDTMVAAYSWSLPGKLEKICNVLHFPPQDCKADFDIMFFSAPIRSTGLFGPEFRDWTKYPKEWAEAEAYCKQDVHCERVLWNFLQESPLTDLEWQGWFLDQKINETGMPFNRTMVTNGLEMGVQSNQELVDWLKEKTQLENPGSPAQIKVWLSTRGYTRSSIRKDFVQEALTDPNSEITPEAREVLKIRQEAAKKSYTKLERLLQVAGPDDRVRYQFRYGGAARTFRWAGGDVQTQNMSRPTKEVKKNYEQAIDLIIARAYDKIKEKYPSVVGMVVGSIRMMFQATLGKKIVISDLNAIENRVLGFLARCPAILEVFEKNLDPYLSFGTYLYGRTYEDLEAAYLAGNEELRINPKAPVLGGGYGLSSGVSKNKDGQYAIIYKVNEFGDHVTTGLIAYAKNVCGVDLEPKLAYEAIAALRKAWPEVVQIWTDYEEAFKQVLKNGKPIRVGEVTWNKKEKKWENCEEVVEGTVIEFDRKKIKYGGYMVRIKLPSGRRLHYLNATLEEETVPGNDGKPWTRTQIYYDGIEHSATQNEDGSTAKKNHVWGRVKTYGGKICENIVQAFARDLLLNGMLLADALGFILFGCFHDELAAEVDDDPYGLGINDMIQCQSESPWWAPGIRLGAAGGESKFYRKF